MVIGRVVEKRSEISNLDLIRDIDRIIKPEESFYPSWTNVLAGERDKSTTCTDFG